MQTKQHLTTTYLLWVQHIFYPQSFPVQRSMVTRKLFLRVFHRHRYYLNQNPPLLHSILPVDDSLINFLVLNHDVPIKKKIQKNIEVRHNVNVEC